MRAWVLLTQLIQSWMWWMRIERKEEETAAGDRKINKGGWAPFCI